MRVFGLIGRELDHSFSPEFFRRKFEREGVKDALYKSFPLKEIAGFPKLVKENEALCGLNVTIPYKEEVIPFLDRLSGTAEAIGAVNTICFENGERIGHNTDAEGFEKDLAPLLAPEHKNALILGTGGASKAVHHALEKMGFDIDLVSRKAKGERILGYEELDRDMISEQDLIVNCTPLGMWPKTEEYPPIPYEGVRPGSILYDLIYEPPKTRFLEFGEKRGAAVRNGHGMLIAQAEAAWRAWNEGCPIE